MCAFHLNLFSLCVVFLYINYVYDAHVQIYVLFYLYTLIAYMSLHIEQYSTNDAIVCALHSISLYIFILLSYRFFCYVMSLETRTFTVMNTWKTVGWRLFWHLKAVFSKYVVCKFSYTTDFYTDVCMCVFCDMLLIIFSKKWKNMTKK